jgi:hypothetical protein
MNPLSLAWPRRSAHSVSMIENDETHENDSTDDGAGDQPAPHPSAPTEDVSRPFDQTNGIVDGLEGDADDPEVFEKTEEAAEPTISKVLPGFNAQL